MSEQGRPKVGILTLSDSAAEGTRVDSSGEEIARTLKQHLGPQGFEVVKRLVLPDDSDGIAQTLSCWADQGEVDLILTTGGTGLGPRDRTPEATLQVVDRLVPGIPEAMRAGSVPQAPVAMLSRAVAGLRGKCLIINLPGSPRAVRECLDAIASVLPHAIAVLGGGDPATEPLHGAN